MASRRRKANLRRCFRGGRPCVPSPLPRSVDTVNVFRAGDTELAFLTNEYSHSGRVTSPREKGQNRRSYMSVNQRSRKAKITFETSRTTSNVVFLRCFVRTSVCGMVYLMSGNASSKCGKSVRVSHGEIISAKLVSEGLLWGRFSWEGRCSAARQPPHKV